LKTLIFEICEHLSWEVSDTRICPVGYGTTYLGLYQGFNELLEQGVIKRFPRLIGIQAEAIAPVYKAFSRKIGQIDRVERKKLLEKGEIGSICKRIGWNERECSLDSIARQGGYHEEETRH
jgi:threonine synthase